MSDDLPKKLRTVVGREVGTVMQEAARRIEADAARIAALEAQLARLKLFIASDVSRAAGLMNSLMPGPLSHDDTHEAYLRRMSALFTAEAEKLDAGVSAALSTPPEGETP